MTVVSFLSHAKSQKHISPDIRLYVIDEKQRHFFINDGIIKKGFGQRLVVSKDRDSVLTAFSKMAFLFDEIIRLRIVGSSNLGDSTELLYLLNLVPVNRKIRTFLDWKVFGPEFTRDMSRLFEVRNDAVHCISIDEVTYAPKDRISLASKTGFGKFSSDLQKAWKSLLKIYVVQQEKVDFSKLSKTL